MQDHCKTIGRLWQDHWKTIGRPLEATTFVVKKQIIDTFLGNFRVMKLKNRKLRIIRDYLNCLWYHVLFPLGTEEDEFTKQWKRKG